jgi:RNA-splicing ligase RtcB
MKKMLSAAEVVEELEKKGIVFRVGSVQNIAEEAPSSYKDVEDVVEICMKLVRLTFFFLLTIRRR